MKKVLKLADCFVVAALVFALSSCSKDEMNEKRIVGEWQSTNVNYKNYEKKYDGDYTLMKNISEDCIGWNVTFVFNGNGKGSVINNTDGKTELKSMTWEVMKDRLYCNLTDDDVAVFSIDFLKGDKMVLTFTDEYQLVYFGAVYKDVMTYTFKKM